jgi:hypothetical protein
MSGTLGEQGYVVDLATGGQDASSTGLYAAMAVASGFARAVLCFRALNGLQR